MTPSKISQKIAAGKIELIERFLRQIEELNLRPAESFVENPISVAAAESLLRRSLEALLDLGRHVLARGFGVPAVEYREVGPKLAECGVLEPPGGRPSARSAPTEIASSTSTTK